MRAVDCSMFITCIMRYITIHTPSSLSLQTVFVCELKYGNFSSAPHWCTQKYTSCYSNGKSRTVKNERTQVEITIVVTEENKVFHCRSLPYHIYHAIYTFHLSHSLRPSKTQLIVFDGSVYVWSSWWTESFSKELIFII